GGCRGLGRRLDRRGRLRRRGCGVGGRRLAGPRLEVLDPGLLVLLAAVARPLEGVAAVGAGVAAARDPRPAVRAGDRGVAPGRRHQRPSSWSSAAGGAAGCSGTAGPARSSGPISTTTSAPGGS